MLNKKQFYKMVKEKARATWLADSKLMDLIPYVSFELAFTAGFNKGLEFIQEEFNQ